MKIGLLIRNLTTIYSLAVVLTCLMAGCIRQPTEVVSQSNTDTKNPLLSSKNSSSFNYFQWKKKLPVDEAVAKVKINGASPVNSQVDSEFIEKPGRVKLVGHSDESSDILSEPKSKQPQKKMAEEKVSSWRSKSLIDSAKKYPARISKAYQQRTDRIRNASHSITRGISSGIERISNKSATSSEMAEPEANLTDSKTAPMDQLRSSEVSHYFDQVADEKSRSGLSKEKEDFRQGGAGLSPISNGLSGELRRFQVTSIMSRAKREFEKKNYEYATFLAEQALELSYRGHIAFGPQEESPQKLLQRIKKHAPPREELSLQKVEHTKPRVQTNGGQIVQNFQFSPAPVHPLKKRTQSNRKKTETQLPETTSSSQELPLIVPRNMGTDQETIKIRKKKSPVQEPLNRSHGISLDSPVFEEKAEEAKKLSIPDQIVPEKQSSVPQLDMKLEAVSEEPPAKIQLGGPETIEQKSEKSVQKSTSPGPQLMLPKLPSRDQDLTSQTKQNQSSQQTTSLKHQGQNQGVQTAPVKFQSKIKPNQPQSQQPVNDNRVVGEESSAADTATPTGLTLDEIEWELDQKVQPQLSTGWSGLSTLLLIIGGAIILLLLTIIFILLRRGNTTTDASVSDEVGPN